MEVRLFNKNFVSLSGLLKTPSKDDVQKAALYFKDHLIFIAETVEKDGVAYIIQVNF